MTSSVLRWTVFGMFIVVLLAATQRLWTSAAASRDAVAATNAFDDRAESSTRAVLELRMAQQSYVAAGQGDEFWGSKVAAQAAALRDELTAIRSLTSTTHARDQIDEALSALGDFERMDARAREYARSNQRLLASDLIFSDGLDKTTAMQGAILAARAAERDAGAALVRTARRRDLMIAGVAAAAAVGLGLVLVPVPRVATVPVPAAAPADTAALAAPDDSLVLRDARDPVPPLPAETPTSIRESEAEPMDPFDLGRVASLCTELARIVDTRSLPAVLERTATVLDANGVVLWVADPDGRELNPIVTFGYPPQLVTRLGTIPRDAPNATAAAFRTALLQTVPADTISNGAIAVPLVTPAGCVGVIAAEVRNGGEQQEDKLAAAAIVAAQLATLVAPPSYRSAPPARAEALG